jgi:hypothetical protein
MNNTDLRLGFGHERWALAVDTEEESVFLTAAYNHFPKPFWRYCLHQREIKGISSSSDSSMDGGIYKHRFSGDFFDDLKNPK